jgi:hypothetical protein
MIAFAKNIFSIGLLAILFITCNKVEKPPVPDITFPNINFTTPEQLKNYNSEAPLNLVGVATDNDLRKIILEVYTLADSNRIFNKTLTIKGTGYTFSEKLTAYTNNNVVNCLAIARVYDGANNSTSDSVYFKLY